MDPDANLNEMLEIADLINGDFDEVIRPGDIERLANLVLSLDEWLSKGGALPERWRRK
jgi:hypothetical protein